MWMNFNALGFLGLEVKSEEQTNLTVLEGRFDCMASDSRSAKYVIWSNFEQT